MGLFSSIFGAKSSTKTTIPSFLKGPLQDYAGSVGGYLNSDPHQYVAPASDLQNQAFSQAQDLGSWQKPLNGALSAVKAAGAAPASSAGAAQQAGGVSINPIERINGASMLSNLNSYLDPTLQATVDSTMADFHRDADQQRAQQQAKLAGSGAFGSGGQFYLSNLDTGNLVKGAALENQLRSQAWNTALGAAGQDADRTQGASAFNAGAANDRSTNQAGMDLQRGMFNAGQGNDVGMFNAQMAEAARARALQAAGMQGDIANSYGQNQRADIGVTAGLGEMQRGIAQDYAGALPNQLLQAGQMFSPLMGLTGQSTTKSPSPFSAALSVASLFSDERLKTDIKRVGTTSKKSGGLGIFTYRYKDDPHATPHMGVMAQEVEKKRPEALGPTVGGYKTVKYGEL